MTKTTTCAVLKRKKIAFRVLRVFCGIVVFVSWVRVRSSTTTMTAVLARWWAAVRVPGGRWKTGNAAHRIDSHALPRRSEYWSRRPPAHGVRYVATPHDKESFKKKKTFRYIPNEMYHHRHGGGGDFFTHKRQKHSPTKTKMNILASWFYLFLFSPLRTKCPKSVLDHFPLFFTIYMGRSTTSGVLP